MLREAYYAPPLQKATPTFCESESQRVGMLAGCKACLQLVYCFSSLKDARYTVARGFLS